MCGVKRMGWSEIELVIKLICKVWCFEDEVGNLAGTTSETKHEISTLLSSQSQLSILGHHIPHVQLSSIARLTAYTSVLINTVHPQCITCNYRGAEHPITPTSCGTAFQPCDRGNGM